MQHAGLQYGQGAVNSHQSPPFAHADIPQGNGGTTTSSLRQFRKKDGTEKNSGTDLNTSVENIARVPPHNHYPARPNDYYRYQPQYPDYNSPYKDTPAQVKYSEIAETPQSIQHVDHISTLQKHKDVHKDFMDMCNISQQTHMKQNYPDNLTRQQSYPPDAASVHHQYLHKEPQVHPGYKPESQYQQYPQISKYNMPSQCRKYPPAPAPENDFLAKLQRINPSMARSIMSDHHIRESQTTYPSIDQSRMYPQNQRFYPPTHLQNNISYNYQPYNYPSSCNYKHPEYSRSNQMGVGGAQYPSINPHTDRSLSPRNMHMMNYTSSPQKISPNYSQYNPPEYAQHYQHRRASLPQDYYQQTCRTNPYMTGQISEPTDNRGGSTGVLRHFIENWAEEEGTTEITPIFKESIRIHNNDSNNEQVFVINSSDIPQCLENVSLVPTENGQYIIKSGALDNSVVRIKETTETNGERTVNLQIVEAPSKPECIVSGEHEKTTVEESTTVPYQENQNEKDCDEITKTSQPLNEQEQTEPEPQQSEETQDKKNDENSVETSVIVSNEVSVIKDMPLIDEEQARKGEEKENKEENAETESKEDNTSSVVVEPPQYERSSIQDRDDTHQDIPQKTVEEMEVNKEVPEENHLVSTTRRTQRIFSVDDIIGHSSPDTRRNSLQFIPRGPDEEVKDSKCDEKEELEESSENTEYRNAISVDDNSVILEIGGAWVQLNINELNGTKVLSVLSLSESLVIDVNGNYQGSQESEENIPIANSLNVENIEETDEENQSSNDKSEQITANEEPIEKGIQNAKPVNESSENLMKDKDIMKATSNETEQLEEIDSSIYENEVVIGDESIDNDVFLDLNAETLKETLIDEDEMPVDEIIPKETSVKEVTAKETLVDDTTIKEILADEAPLKQPPAVETTAIESLTDETICKETSIDEEIKKPILPEMNSRRDEKRKHKDSKSSNKKVRSEERRGCGDRRYIEERIKSKKVQKSNDSDFKFSKKSKIENIKFGSESKKESGDVKKKDSSSFKKPEKKFTFQTNEDDISKKDKIEKVVKPTKQEKKLTPQNSSEDDESKKKYVHEEFLKFKKSEKKLTSQVSLNAENESKKKENVDTIKTKKQEKKLVVSETATTDGDDNKQKNIQEENIRMTRKEKKMSSMIEKNDMKNKGKSEEIKETKLLSLNPNEEESALQEATEESFKKKEEKLTSSVTKEEAKKASQSENIKVVKKERKLISQEGDSTGKHLNKLNKVQNVDYIRRDKKLTSQSSIEEKNEDISLIPSTFIVIKESEELKEENKINIEEYKEKENDFVVKESKLNETIKEGFILNPTDVIKVAEEMISLKQLEETKDPEKLPTKAAKKLYITDPPIKEIKLTVEENLKQKKSMSKLEEAVNKIKSLKEKSFNDSNKLRKTVLKDTTERKSSKVTKKVTFNLETEVREISKEEIDKKKLSLEEYNSRKRKVSILNEPEELKNKIMEDTVTSSDDINDEMVEQVAMSTESAIIETSLKKSPPKMTSSNWEEDTSSPGSPDKDEVMSTTNRKCIIDVNEFSIKPIESISTPSPVSSSQFSYHSEEDSLQVYKDVVDSKLNSLNIKIPKLSKPKPVDRFSVLLDRFLNKGSLNYEELEEVKKFIEIKRKMMAEEKKQLTYEVRGERDYKDLKLHFRKVPEKRKKKRFRNLYTEDSSDDSDSSRSDKAVGNYSVYQRDSQGVPKLIFKRKSGLPQPFVKLERSQAVELLAKKRKLY